MKKQLIIPCIRSVMGDWVYYSSSMSVEEISERVTTDKKYRENPNLDEILQRDLKNRKETIARYLLNDESRFFNSIIIGVFGGIPQWHEFSIDKKVQEISNADIDEYSHSVGLLEFQGDEEMFAIDGQHRVAGMQIAHEKESNKDEDEQKLADDKFPVIFIAHIDDPLGKKRTRKLFSDINKNAKPVAEGDKIKIDEENLNAIVTRRIYANYKYFQKGKLISLTESARLENNDVEHFTNLLGINNTNKVLRKLFKKVSRTHEWEEINVVSFYKVAEEFYDFIIENVEQYKKYFKNRTLSLKTARKNNAYILFRPVGLKLLAGLYVHFFIKNELNLLKKYLINVSFIMPNSPFNKVLWNNGKMEAKDKNQRLALNIALYIFNEIPKYEEDSLLENYREILKDAKANLPEKISLKIRSKK